MITDHLWLLSHQRIKANLAPRCPRCSQARQSFIYTFDKDETSEILSQLQFSHLNFFFLDPLNNHWKHWDICEVSLDTFDQHCDGGDIDVDVKKHLTPDDGDGDGDDDDDDDDDDGDGDE